MEPVWGAGSEPSYTSMRWGTRPAPGSACSAPARKGKERGREQTGGRAGTRRAVCSGAAVL